MGMIARDCMRRFLGARSLTHTLKVDAKIAETIAALGAVQFNNEVGFLDAIFEGNAAQVISYINSSPPYLFRIGHFFDSIHVEIESMFEFVLFYFYT